MIVLRITTLRDAETIVLKVADGEIRIKHNETRPNFGDVVRYHVDFNGACVYQNSVTDPEEREKIAVAVAEHLKYVTHWAGVASHLLATAP